mmetsp:Transcript_14893/g.37521  ORF Transcript_14893/g.37521 Transcript_14893/m.37521 type:complete len:275 (-) Transcript_14893:25-849(-)
MSITNLFSDLGKFRSHGINGFLVSFNGSGFLKDGRSGNHHVNTRFGNFLDVVNLDTSIDLQTAVKAVVINKFSGFSGLVEGSGNEGLSSESRVDRHEKDDVKLVQDVLAAIERCSRVENKSSLASSFLDQGEGSVNVVAGLRVECDVGSSGINEGLDGFIDGGNHKVDIDGGGDTVVAKGLADHRSDCQVRNVVVVHDIKVNNIGSGLQHVVDLGTEAGEISRKDGRSNQVVLVSPNVQGSSRTSGGLGCGEGTGGGEGGGDGEKAELHFDSLF